MTELCSIKWITKNIAIRKTNEVEIRVEILDNGKRIVLHGTGDLEHHLIEDAAILLKKIAEVRCGHTV
jgi:hypothetical protein